jgi:hypothetical protein
LRLRPPPSRREVERELVRVVLGQVAERRGVVDGVDETWRPTRWRLEERLVRLHLLDGHLHVRVEHPLHQVLHEAGEVHLVHEVAGQVAGLVDAPVLVALAVDQLRRGLGLGHGAAERGQLHGAALHHVAVERLLLVVLEAAERRRPGEDLADLARARSV